MELKRGWEASLVAGSWPPWPGVVFHLLKHWQSLAFHSVVLGKTKAQPQLQEIQAVALWELVRSP